MGPTPTVEFLLSRGRCQNLAARSEVHGAVTGVSDKALVAQVLEPLRAWPVRAWVGVLRRARGEAKCLLLVIGAFGVVRALEQVEALNGSH